MVICNRSKAYNQINWSRNQTLNGNFSWNFTELNIKPIGSWLFNFTNNNTQLITVQMKLNQTNPSKWQLFYGGINLTKLDYTSVVDISANSTKLINLTMNLYNISETYVNWTKTIKRY